MSTPASSVPDSDRWVPKITSYARGHAELVFAVFMMVSVFLVFHWVPYKLAFLSFFYLPVLAAGYLLGSRQAALATVMCVLLVTSYYAWAWVGEALREDGAVHVVVFIYQQHFETVISLAMWGGFLILTGITFSRVRETMANSFLRTRELSLRLTDQTAELGTLNEALQKSATELQSKAEELQEKSLLIEQLKQQTEQTLYSTMDATVARLMIQGRLRQEKRNISVLFCDLKDFAASSEERTPEAVLQDLNGFYRDVELLADAYHGHIDKFMGDGIMVEFGAPVDYRHHSLQAVTAGLKIQETFRGVSPFGGLRIGIASGDAVVGLLGNRRRSYSALGEVVNLASRLKNLCEPSTLYIDETAYEAVRGYVEVEPLRNLNRRGQDRQAGDQVRQKEQELAADPQNAQLLLQLGQLHFQLQEVSKALEYYRRALELKPEDAEVKLAYADASLRREELEKVSIKGLSKRKAVYRVLSLLNPLLQEERVPSRVYERYKDAVERLEIPDDVILPTEVIDGTVGHSRLVAFFSYALADHMGLPEELKQDAILAGRLQDTGKSAVWHHSLNRQGGLSDQERREIEGHVQVSVATAKRMGFDRPGVLEIIENHHELLNGSGYPRGLRGENIPLGARITGVADAYAALISWRPYRPPWDPQVARGELRRGVEAGKYDLQVVSALTGLLG